MAFRFNALKDHNSEKVSFQQLSSPWEKKKKEGWEAVWQNPNNQSLISYFSSCSSSIPFTSLKDFQQDFLSGLKSVRLLKQKKIFYQKQKAHRLSLRNSGSHKQQHRMEILLFKKEQCFYVLSFLAHSHKALLKDVKIFNQFIKGFKVL